MPSFVSGSLKITASNDNEWRNAESLIGCQLFVKGSAGMTAVIQLSPIPRDSTELPSTAGNYEEFSITAADGFQDPPAAADRPFAQWNIVISVGTPTIWICRNVV